MTEETKSKVVIERNELVFAMNVWSEFAARLARDLIRADPVNGPVRVRQARVDFVNALRAVTDEPLLSGSAEKLAESLDAAPVDRPAKSARQAASRGVNRKPREG